MCAKIDIKVELMKALAKLYHNDHSLIRRKCCERSIVFRLGHYLVNSMEEYNLDVDCEYNRNGDNPKSLTGKKHNSPDIVIHKRETNEYNLLIMEVKTPNDAHEDDFKNDKEKLIGFTEPDVYSYEWGVHLYISATVCSMVWWQNGQAVQKIHYQVKKDTHDLEQVDGDLKRPPKFEKWYIDNVPMQLKMR